MAGASAFNLSGSRLQNATRVNQAAEDADVTGWAKANDFIICAMVETTAHGGATLTVQLRWRNVTDSGSFAALSGSGELTWSGATDLVNGNTVASGEEVCTPFSSTTRVDGVEREGANDVSTTLAQNEYCEHQFAIDASGGLDGKQYEFEIYDVTSGVAVGTCLAQITTLTADVNALASVVNLTLTEYPATVNAETNVNAGVTALTLTTYGATVSLGGDTNVNATVVNLILTEYSATVNAETKVQAAVDALTLTTYAATVSVGADVNVPANVTTLTLTAYQCAVNAAANIQAGVDPLILSVLAATVSLDINIAASVDALMLTNYRASVTGTAAPVSPDGAAKVVAYAPPPVTIVQGSRIPRIINDPRTPKIVKK